MSCAGPDAPLIARMAGSLTDVNLRTMLNPVSPVWPETLGTTAPRQTMRAYNRASFYIEGGPSGKALISGHVNAAVLNVSSIVAAADWPTFGDGVIPDDPPTITRQNDVPTQTSALVAKLAVRRERFPGWTLINADSTLVVDAGEIEVVVLGPNSWVGGAVPAPIPVAPAEDTPFQFVDVRVKACPLTCCWPPAGRLSMWSLADPGSDPADRTHVRPRRATALRIGGSGDGGGAFSVMVTEGASVIGGYITHNIQVNGGFINSTVDPLGSFNHFTVQNTPGLVPVAFDWEIS